MAGIRTTYHLLVVASVAFLSAITLPTSACAQTAVPSVANAPTSSPVHELVVIPDGPKFKPSADQTKTGNGSTSIQGSRTHGKLTAHDIPMSSLAKSLAGQVHRTVIDKTGLTGNFDLALKWSNDESTEAGAEYDPTIFTAVQEQLGLKLQSAKGPVETLVVDQASIPSDN